MISREMDKTVKDFMEVIDNVVTEKTRNTNDKHLIRHNESVKSAAIHSTLVCWDDVRNNAAIAVLPQCVATVNDVLARGGALTEDTMAKQAAKMAVAYADELVNELKKIGE